MRGSAAHAQHRRAWVWQVAPPEQAGLVHGGVGGMDVCNHTASHCSAGDALIWSLPSVAVTRDSGFVAYRLGVVNAGAPTNRTTTSPCCSQYPDKRGSVASCLGCPLTKMSPVITPPAPQSKQASNHNRTRGVVKASAARLVCTRAARVRVKRGSPILQCTCLAAHQDVHQCLRQQGRTSGEPPGATTPRSATFPAGRLSIPPPQPRPAQPCFSATPKWSAAPSSPSCRPRLPPSALTALLA